MAMINTNNHSCPKVDEDFVLTVLLVAGRSSIVTCLLGLLSNTVSIIVLANKRMRRSSTNIYLLALAIVNFLWLTLFLYFMPFVYL